MQGYKKAFDCSNIPEFWTNVWIFNCKRPYFIRVSPIWGNNQHSFTSIFEMINQLKT